MNATNDNGQTVNTVTRGDLLTYVAYCQAIVDAHYAREAPSQGAILTIMTGRRYARIVQSGTGLALGRSVYCFVDMTNGDILKADSWKGPAKGPRGNIFKMHANTVTPGGAHYYSARPAPKPAPVPSCVAATGW